MFHAESRFIVVFKETDLVAYGMFRFEVDESSDVLYWYWSGMAEPMAMY